MAGRYDSNPFAEEEEVNPFSVSIFIDILLLFLLNLDVIWFSNLVDFVFKSSIVVDLLGFVTVSLSLGFGCVLVDLKIFVLGIVHEFEVNRVKFPAI